MLQDHSLAHLCVTLKRTRLPGEALEPIINVGDYDDVGSKAQIAWEWSGKQRLQATNLRQK